MSQTGTVLIALLAVAALVFCSGCTQPQSSPGTATSTPIIAESTTVTAASQPASAPGQALSGKNVRLETSMGNITIALRPDMPVTTGNFEKLVLQGYYDGVIFHRVIDGFMIQAGAPAGSVRGGPGYTIPDEFTGTNKNTRGSVAMANAGPNTGSSQFFINTVDNDYLDTKHPVFGQVVEGMDVVDAIAKVPTSGKPDYRPLENVTILRAGLI